MDHSAATGHSHSPMIKSANSEKGIISSSHCASTPSASGSVRENEEDQVQLQWAAIERLPTFQRLRFSLFDDSIGGSGPASTDVRVKRVIDVAKLGAQERHAVIENLIKNVENDNRRLLQKLRERTDKVDARLPTVEVRYKNLSVEAECEVVYGKPLPTLWSTAKSLFSQFPKWWHWFYWLSPTSWSLKGPFPSQYGDITEETTVFGKAKGISSFPEDYFGYHYDQLVVVAIVLATFPPLCFSFCLLYREIEFPKKVKRCKNAPLLHISNVFHCNKLLAYGVFLYARFK